MNEFVTKLPRNYKIQKPGKQFRQSELSGLYANCELHHVFQGKNRKWSDYYGLVIWITEEEHRLIHTGKKPDWVDGLHRAYQSKYELYCTREQFRQNFGRSYL